MKLLSKIIVWTLTGTILFSCEKPEQLGPDVKGIYGPVTVTQTLSKSDANPDFSAGETVYFTAAFENDAIWTLTIVGQTSGAKKTITGVSKQLAAYNATWDGTADEAPSFQAENVMVTLSFQSSTTTLNESLAIAGRKDLDAGGVIVSNFDVNKMYCYCGPADPNGWPSDWPATVNTNTSYVEPDGTPYLVMGDTVNAKPWKPGGNDPYVDILTIEAKNADVNYGSYYPLYADPNKVYFNIMVYATTTPDTWLRVIIMEEGGSLAGGTDRYVDIRPDWNGWKLLSYNYTELLSDVNSPLKPNKVTAVQFILLSDANPLPGDDVWTIFDHVIFTHNKPYQP